MINKEITEVIESVKRPIQTLITSPRSANIIETEGLHKPTKARVILIKGK